jgi:NAD(P)H dehydrogenase (quinone)
MQDVNVVVVFYSRTGLTEKTALAAAVGAVEGKANIRLRRIPETAGDEAIATVPGWRENHERMSWEYIAPREADTLWAEGFIVAIPEWLALSSPEVNSYLDTLAGKILAGKFAAALGPKGLDEALAALGLVVVPPATGADAVECARLAGVRVADAARAEKFGRSSH